MLTGYHTIPITLTLHIGAISAALAGGERCAAMCDGLPILLEIIIFSEIHV
jgi:hypothetical protein